MTKTHINWEMFHEACVNTAQLVNKILSPVHTIVAISRGGLVPARIMAEHIKSEHFVTMGIKLYDGDKRGEKISVYQDLPDHLSQYRDRNLLVIDDVSDGGSTFKFAVDRIRQRTNYNVFTAAPYIKRSTKFVPDAYVTEFPDDEWIVFPFERD